MHMHIHLRSACSSDRITRDEAKRQLDAGNLGSIMLSTDPAGASATRACSKSHQIILMAFEGAHGACDGEERPDARPALALRSRYRLPHKEGSFCFGIAR